MMYIKLSQKDNPALQSSLTNTKLQVWNNNNNNYKLLGLWLFRLELILLQHDCINHAQKAKI